MCRIRYRCWSWIIRGNSSLKIDWPTVESSMTLVIRLSSHGNALLLIRKIFTTMSLLKTTKISNTPPKTWLSLRRCIDDTSSSFPGKIDVHSDANLNVYDAFLTRVYFIMEASKYLNFDPILIKLKPLYFDQASEKLVFLKHFSILRDYEFWKTSFLLVAHLNEIITGLF